MTDRATTVLPDGSAFAVIELPLPKDHWLFEDSGKPPMPQRIGTDNPMRAQRVREIREAARYAIKASTMSGQEMDFDPDALVQNIVIGLLGYFTPDGTTQTSDAHVSPTTGEEPVVDTRAVYESRKRVIPTPMTRGDYNTLRGWETPSDENPADAGYLVEYLDGGGANHPDYPNYISWSPKEIFDRNYVKL